MKFPKLLICMTILVGGLVPCGLAYAQSVEEFDSTSPAADISKSQPAQVDLDISQVTEMIVTKTNAFRQQHDLRPLASNRELTETAKYFADFMARRGKYGHRADDQQPSERAKNHGYEYCIVLENIAYAYRSTGFGTRELADKFMHGWKNSTGHRENMLDPDTYETGVAVSRSEEKAEYFAVQMFGRPRSQAIRFQVSNMSNQEIEYTVDRTNSTNTFTLPPRVSRTHTQCRSSQLDLAWTEKEDALPVRGGQRFVIRSRGSKGLEVSVSDSMNK